ncbi:hypothetical protein ACRFB9_28145 [Klebsiella pneumoniae]
MEREEDKGDIGDEEVGGEEEGCGEVKNVEDEVNSLREEDGEGDEGLWGEID